MALSSDGAVLFVGYFWSKCVVAYDVATLQQIWKASFGGNVCSIACHDGAVIVVARDVPLTTLSAEDGSILRALPCISEYVDGISAFAGLLDDRELCC